jgi:hypothetical protein
MHYVMGVGVQHLEITIARKMAGQRWRGGRLEYLGEIY